MATRRKYLKHIKHIKHRKLGKSRKSSKKHQRTFRRKNRGKKEISRRRGRGGGIRLNKSQA